MKILYILLLYCFNLSIVHAQPPINYHLSWKQESSIIGSSIGIALADYVIDKNNLTITINDIGILNSMNVNALDRSATDNYSTKAADVSDYFRDIAFVAPLGLFLSSKVRSQSKETAVMYLEALSLTASVTSIFKTTFRRVRPFVYNPEVPIELKLTKSSRRSFFSGHVSHVAAMSFFTAKVYTDLHPDSKYKYLIWGLATSAPAITGYLRYKSGKHFPTDIAVGYLIGGTIGYLVPWLHHSEISEKITFTDIHNGIGLMYTF